jgi:UDPglucose 6-dehydrogenase
MIEKIISIEKVAYDGFVYNLEVEPTHDTQDDQYYLNADTGLVVHNCHPRDNIALRWLAEEYDIGYDLFGTVMSAREVQARNLAEFLITQSQLALGLPIAIHGKAYKPDVPYCIGSYSTLVGHYINQRGIDVKYIDPLADDSTDVVAEMSGPAVYLWAHNRKITYEYTGNQLDTQPYCTIHPGSVIVDPWRKLSQTNNGDVKVVYYGNTRKNAS